jgi:hypothetical protein
VQEQAEAGDQIDLRLAAIMGDLHAHGEQNLTTRQVAIRRVVVADQ